MEISILFGFMFIVCWVLLMVSLILTLITQTKLKKTLKAQAPNVRNNLKFGFSSLNDNTALDSPFGIFKVLLSFGNKVKVRSFLNQFFDIDSVDNLDNQQIKDLSNKLINLFSKSIRLWAIAIFLVLIGALTLILTK